MIHRALEGAFDLEVWRSCRHGAVEVWRLGGMEVVEVMQEALAEAEDSGGSKHEALEAVEGSLEEVEGSGGRKHEALETGGISGNSRKLWIRQEALEAAGSSGGGLKGSEGDRRL
jgi:hypothetical protein